MSPIRFKRLSPESTQGINYAADICILVSACVIAAMHHGQLHWKVAIVMASTAIVIWGCASRMLCHYVVWNGRGFLGDIALTLVLVATVALSVAALQLVPRVAMAMQLTRFFGVMLPAVLLVRLRATGLRLWRERPIQQVLVIGVGGLGRLTVREIRDSGKRRMVIGYLGFDDQRSRDGMDAPVLGSAKELERVLRERVVNEVYVATAAARHADEVQEAIRSCERFGVPFALPACGYRFARAKPARPDAIPDGYVHYTSVQYKPVQRALKRILDILASSAALMLLTPILAITALAIRLTSRGPILFRQVRVGLHGRTFEMLKFRSMVPDAEQLQSALAAANELSGPVFKMKRDPRVTAVGSFIRKYSVDELPQLVNVLRGDMSIVGPRPPLPSEVERYKSWQRRRLSVRPGLTCLWQVSGRNEISFEDWMLLDMRYIDHWTLAQDLGLIVKTVPVVLTGRGAS
jgi:exopolysaccharide biosynthesis polyprenyl glycosylphosphotransferase